ncbi:MAG TPA: holo-ACP synthase [Chloroflexota bacterium]|nr:holo-ACP synthase [Chloroflexota bacterium]
MFIGTGVDLARVDRLARLSTNARFLRRVFTPAELDDPRPSHLAGIFAAKEAVFKAIGQPPCWQALSVSRAENGRPTVRLDVAWRDPRLRALDVSISHEGEWAIAVAIAVFDREGDGV